MNPIKTGFLAVITGGLLLGVSAGIGASNAFAAVGPESPAGTNNITSVACQAAEEDWTDCTVTLNQSVGVDAIGVTIPSADGTMAYCDGGTSSGGDEGSSGCGLASGNTAVFDVSDYEGGTQFNFSVLDTSGMLSANQLAQQVTVTTGS